MATDLQPVVLPLGCTLESLSDGSQANHGLVSRIGHLLLSGSLPVLQHRGGRLPRTGITLPTFRFLPFGRNMDGIHIFGPPNLGPALVLETMEKITTATAIHSQRVTQLGGNGLASRSDGSQVRVGLALHHTGLHRLLGSQLVPKPRGGCQV